MLLRSGTLFIVLQVAMYCMCVFRCVNEASAVFLSFRLLSLSPRLPYTCHLARLTPGSSPPNAHTYTLAHTHVVNPRQMPALPAPAHASRCQRISWTVSALRITPWQTALVASPCQRSLPGNLTARAQGGQATVGRSLHWAGPGEDGPQGKDKKENGDICREREWDVALGVL